jgi:hypothetical protein
LLTKPLFPILLHSQSMPKKLKFATALLWFSYFLKPWGYSNTTSRSINFNLFYNF